MAAATVGWALAPATVAVGVVHPFMTAYHGKLGRRGQIEIDVAAGQASVYFDVRCRGRELATTDPQFVDVAYGVLTGAVRHGQLVIRTSEGGMSLGPDAPVARIRIRARVGPRRVAGTFALRQRNGCATGRIRFRARS